MKFQPKYKELTFKSRALFDDFLREKAYLAIYFEGEQDLQKMIVDKEGEILDCDANQSMYLGGQVDLKELKSSQPLRVLNSTGNCWNIMGGLIVAEIVY